MIKTHKSERNEDFITLPGIVSERFPFILFMFLFIRPQIISATITVYT